MRSISIGFHATPEEVCSFVYKVVEQNDLIIIASKISPRFEFRVIDQTNYIENCAFISNSRFIFLSTEIIQGLSNDYNTFLAQNADNLIIQIGESTNKFIRESTIGTRCQDPNKLKMWKDIINQFKKQMHQGVWAINPNNQARCLCKNNYYSGEALLAYRNGVVMKAFAGWNEYQFEE